MIKKRKWQKKFEITEGDVTLEIYPYSNCCICKGTGYDNLFNDILLFQEECKIKVCECVIEQIPFEMEKCKMVFIL